MTKQALTVGLRYTNSPRSVCRNIYLHTRVECNEPFCFILHEAAALAGWLGGSRRFFYSSNEKEREALAHTQSSTKECHFSVLFAKSSQANRFSLSYIYIMAGGEHRMKKVDMFCTCTHAAFWRARAACVREWVR